METVASLLIALTAYTPMTHLQSRHLLTITIKLHPTDELGQTPAGNRRVFAVSGGDFKGDRLQGIILPIIGSDLLLTRPDGSSQQDVRMLLRTDDGATILMTYRGVRHASTEVNERLARGEGGGAVRVLPADCAVFRDLLAEVRLAEQGGHHRRRRTAAGQRDLRSLRDPVAAVLGQIKQGAGVGCFSCRGSRRGRRWQSAHDERAGYVGGLMVAPKRR